MPYNLPTLRAFAAKAYDEGFLAFVDALAGWLAKVGPPDATLLNLAGKVALDCGRPDLALPRFERAVAADPYFKPASKNLQKAKSAKPTPVTVPDAASRFLVVRAWGHGFWSDVDQVLGNLLLAELCGRTPIVHWGPESRYAAAGAGEEDNAWLSCFSPVSQAGLAEARAAAKHGIWPPQADPHALHLGLASALQRPATMRPTFLQIWDRNEPVVVTDMHVGIAQLAAWIPPRHRLHGATIEAIYRDLTARYLTPVPSLLDAEETFAREHFTGPMVGLHARGSDKVFETHDDNPLPRDQVELFEAALARLPGAKVFLLTDSTPVVGFLEKRFGDRLVLTPSTRTGGMLGLHYEAGRDGPRLAREVVLDTRLAARCDAFVGLGWSNVSCMARHYRDWPQGSCVMSGQDLHESITFLPLAPDWAKDVLAAG